ncbi:MAG: hypothetical protein M3N30_13690 [Bacteroidota bacterium]|nr:hypothetical protein [Bacteroidota bacterium]
MTTGTLPAERHTRFFKWSIYILGTLFFLNCFTPLRLHYDMLRYFSIKDCIESKCPPGADSHDFLPYGYTGLLLLLSSLGILRSFTIVFINCLYLLGGLFFVRKIFSIVRFPFFMFYLVLMNWTIIKFVSHPLSELQYLFFSIASLYAFNLFVRNKTVWNLLGAFLFAALAFLTRTVGIALIIALFLALVWEFRGQVIGLAKKYRIGLAAFMLSVAGILIFSRQLGLNHYRGVMSRQFEQGLRYSDMIGWHFSEWGEIFINTSRYRIIELLPGFAVSHLFIAAGILAICGFVYISYVKKNNIPFVVKAYLVLYILLVFTWPFADPRFWVPVIPLIAAIISQAIFRQKMGVKYFNFLYLLIYSFLGLISLVYMTFTSFNKKEFSKTQAKGVYRNEYETHFFGRPLSDTATQVNPYLVDLLNSYDK